MSEQSMMHAGWVRGEPGWLHEEHGLLRPDADGWFFYPLGSAGRRGPYITMRAAVASLCATPETRRKSGPTSTLEEPE